VSSVVAQLLTSECVKALKEDFLQWTFERAWHLQHIGKLNRKIAAAAYLLNAAEPTIGLPSNPVHIPYSRIQRTRRPYPKHTTKYVFKSPTCKRCGEASHRGRCKRKAA
jgi:hypothetical protein